MKKEKIKKNKACLVKVKRNEGFAILFAVVISSIILAVALGVAEISLKEIKFSTEAQQTNNAFFAADTGAECTLFNDKSTSNSFVQNGSSGTVTCLGGSIILSGRYPFWTFILSGLGSTGQGCARVSVNKSNSSITSVVSRGYNNGGKVAGFCRQGLNTVERELDLNY